MTIKIIIVLLLGIYFGEFISQELYMSLNSVSDIYIYIILFTAGLSIGYTGDIKRQFKGLDLDIIMVPIFTIIGTLAGSYISSFFLDMDNIDCLAAGSGLAWYSLSAVMISEVNSVLGAVSFMANVFREVLALIFIPFVARKIGFTEAVSLGGASSGDTTLPPLSKNTDTRTVIIALFSGIIISFFVPVLVKFFLSLKY